MLKNFFILLFSITVVYSSTAIDEGNLKYIKQNYVEAIEHYKDAYSNNHPKARIKLIMSYLKLGGNFEKIKNYPKALSWYNKALELKSKVAKSKISKIYEKQANDYNRVKKYKTALRLYKKALKYGNSNVNKKIKKIKIILAHQKTLKNDTRKIVTNKSPSWTKAIGRLIIPTKLEFITKKRYKTNYKKCSASLINIDNLNYSKVIVTASHCLTEYKKSTGDLRFIIKDSSGKMIQKTAVVYKDSNYSSKKLKTNSDYAILILSSGISAKDVNPFIINKNSFTLLQKNSKNSFASLAGFSGDIGEFGAKLTYDPKCKLTYHSYTYGASDCSGFKGASGGPVVVTTTDNNENLKYNFVGVISHFKNKSYQKIFFAPHHIFYKDLIKSIKRYNY
ncbi:MAG: trypsin-like serine protease [Campylobacterota bacterium]|nr:trypsin-like serine protease [Campylobacterota bacterium]